MKSSMTISHSAPWISEEDIDNVARILRSGMIARGKETEAFESEFAAMVGSSFVKATTSGASAISVALKSLRVGLGDEVIIPTYVCDSVKYAVRAVGAKEVLCDIGPDWVVNTATVTPRIGSCTKAIIAVHIFGIAVDSTALRATGIPVVEDCCQALGRIGDGNWIGTGGDVAAFSFHPTKCLAAGEGGIVATSNPDIAQRIADMSVESKSYFGFSDLQATLARSQLYRYDSVLQRRRDIAHQYFELLPTVCTATIRELWLRSMFFRFPLTCHGDFEVAQRKLADRGIQVRRGVDSLLHRQAGLPDQDFPNATRALRQTISIPILPQLVDDDVHRVAREVVSLFQEAI